MFGPARPLLPCKSRYGPAKRIYREKDKNEDKKKGKHQRRKLNRNDGMQKGQLEKAECRKGSREKKEK